MESEYHDPLPPDDAKTPEQAARKIRLADREHLYIFRRGKQIRRFIGESNRVTPRPEYLFEMKDSVIVHNHPKGYSFSKEDIEAVVRFNARELILATPNFIYMVARPKQGWSIDFDQELTERQYQTSYRFAVDTVNKQISANEVSFSDKDALIIHYLWVAFFDMNGIHYARQKTI